VITNYLFQRTLEIQDILDKGVVQFIQTEQPLRTGILLEVLDYVRPRMHSRYEHKLTNNSNATKRKKRRKKKA